MQAIEILSFNCFSLNNMAISWKVNASREEEACLQVSLAFAQVISSCAF